MTKKSVTILLAITLSILTLILSYPDTLFAQSDIRSQIKNQLEKELSDPTNGNAKIFIKCDSNGIYSLTEQKQTESGYLLIIVIQDGKVLDSQSTTAQYGVVSLAGNCASHGLFPGLFS